MSSIDVGIDLGTSKTAVSMPGRGIVLNEPTAVAVRVSTGKIIAFGAEAYQMAERTPTGIHVVFPLQNGVIDDYLLTQELIKYILGKIRDSAVLKPRIIFCVPSEVTEVETKSIAEAAVAAGARKVYLLEEPVAAALGAGLDISHANGRMIVDVGAGTSDIAILSLSGIVSKTSIRLAGNHMDDAIVRAVRNRYNLLIGRKTAEKIKMEAINVLHSRGGQRMSVKGRSLSAGLPRMAVLDGNELYEDLEGIVSDIIGCIRSVLEKTPPELVADVGGNGILLTGGGALIKGFAEKISAVTGIEVTVPENPRGCVSLGTAAAFSCLDTLQSGLTVTSKY